MAFDFDAAVQAPFRMQPGLRRMPPSAAHLTPATNGGRHQREKLAVFSSFAHQALLSREGFDARPLLLAFAAFAATEQPQHWQFDGVMASALGVRVSALDGSLLARGAGTFGLGDEVSRCLSQLAPIWRLPALLALTFEEDFAFIDGADASIPWLAVALPSHWAPEDKVGRHFAQVHAPVADNRLLVTAGEHLIQLVTASERWERFVWTITSHPRLHAHPDRLDPSRWPPSDDPQLIANLAWWRTERQTFWPVPSLRQAVFTIGVQLAPLSQALQAPAQLQRVRDALASMSEPVLEYRSLSRVREPLLRWMDMQLSQRS